MNQIEENGPDEFNGRDVLSLSEDESRSFLCQIGYEFLTVADDDKAHAFPVSFGYDGASALYYQFGSEERSRKMAFVEATKRATTSSSVSTRQSGGALSWRGRSNGVRTTNWNQHMMPIRIMRGFR